MGALVRGRRRHGAGGRAAHADHDLRACATLLLTAGEELAVIAKVLGHADDSTTLKVHAHLDPERATAAPGRIDAALGRQPVAAEAAV